jgi:FMN phosphatase YigB (HAD superfamily)
MALTLQQYATYLDTRSDLSWPAAPEIERPSAKPHLVHLPDVRAITWSVYGTLLAIGGGELYFEHPNAFVMEVALGKIIQEFKMWDKMSRKPGKPSDHLKQIYSQVLTEQRALGGAVERYPEILADRLWEACIKKLLKNEYTWDAGFYGALNEFSHKMAYFFHSSLQGITSYPGAVSALRHVKGSDFCQGLIADTQCFTLLQLQRCLARQDPAVQIQDLIDPELCACSHELRVRRPAERAFRHVLSALGKHGIDPPQVLHIGSDIARDVVPAKRLGMKAGLFAGDKASIHATSKQLKEPVSRPDVLLTELTQIADVVGKGKKNAS